MAPAHAFDTDTEMELVGDGRFSGDFSDRWNALGGVVNGGYYVACCLRALQHVLPHRDPLVVSTFFSRPGEPGPIEILTDTARVGRRHSTGNARLFQYGKELVRTTATFADLDRHEQCNARSPEPPKLPPPEEAIDPIGGQQLPGVTMTDQVEFRYATLPGWRRGEPTGDATAEFWLRFKGREADALSLPLLVDGAAPAVLELGVAGSATVQLTTHVRARPADGWLACRATTRTVAGGYHEEDFDV